MNEPVDWTDETLRPLDELARIAFPTGAGVTADTLKRRARQGKLIGSDQERAEKKRLRDEERANGAAARRYEMQERRRARARAQYREKKAERARDAPK